MSTCLPIRLTMRLEHDPSGIRFNYLTCKTRPRSWSDAQRQQFLEKRRRSSALFDRLETVCPHLFRPRGLASEGDGTQFWRNYVGADIFMQQRESGLIVYQNVFTRTPGVRVGQLEEIEKTLPGKQQICP
jgi:hypothetical protein